MSTTGGNLGIHRGWVKGEDDWHNLPLTEDEYSGGMEGNLHKLDTVVHLSVKDITNTPPGAPAVDDRYLTGSSPTGAWADHPSEIAVCTDDDPVAWAFYHVKTGWLINVEDELKILVSGAGEINISRFIRHTNSLKTVPVVIDPDTPTKQLCIDVSGVTGTKTLTMPNKDVTPMHVGGDSMSGELNMQDNLITRPHIKDESKVAVIGASSALGTIDLANGNVYRVTLDGTWTPIFSNWPADTKYGEVIVMVQQSSGGGNTIDWGIVAWPGGTPPTMTSTADQMDIYRFRTLSAGVLNIFGEIVGQNYNVNDEPPP